MTEAKGSPFLTPEQCRAEFFPNIMGRNKFYEAMKAGQIPGVVKIGDRLFISRKAMQDLAEGKSTQECAR